MEASKDIRTLIRYVLPGLVFVLEFVLLSWILGWLDQERFGDAWDFLTKKESAAIVLGAITVFLGSGAAGYMFASVQHAIINSAGPKLRGCWGPLRWIGIILSPRLDYSPVLRNLVVENLLCVEGLDKAQIKFEESDPPRDWVIVTTLWHERRETNQQIKATTTRAESLWDTAHGHGSLVVGSIFAFLAAELGLTLYRDWDVNASFDLHSSVRVVIGSALGLFFIGFHRYCWGYMVGLACDFVGTVLLNQVRYDKQKDDKIVRLFYAGETGRAIPVHQP